jgi:site-specific recombinase XerD
MAKDLVPAGAAALPIPTVAIAVLQRTPNATFAAEEFFKANISNEHTRRAYGRIVGRFLGSCNKRKLGLHNVTPGLAGEYIGHLEGSAPTKNQALAALRKFFDALVQRHAVGLNPFASVSGIKHKITEGRTAELSIEQAKKLLRTIKTEHVVGLRDRAVLGVLAYTGARVGAVAKLRLSDYRNLGEHQVLRFKEKGGKDRDIPVRLDLAAWLNEYLQAAAIAEDSKSKAPLFRAADGKRKVLTPAPYGPHLMRQMMKRRLEDAGLSDLFSPHSFRVTVVTDLLNQNVPLEDIQYLAGHSSPTTTRIYDRRRRQITQNIVERISI